MSDNVDWFASKTPVGELACDHCPQHFGSMMGFRDHMVLDHVLIVDVVSAYPTAMKAAVNAAYGKLHIVK